MLLDDGGQYIGEFKDGLKHGQGKEIEANGDYYEGDFEYGKGKHGVGTQHDAVLAALDKLSTRMES